MFPFRISPDIPFSPTKKADGYDITELLLKVALNTITLTLPTGKMVIVLPRSTYGQDKEFEYIYIFYFLIICRYLDLVKNN